MRKGSETHTAEWSITGVMSCLSREKHVERHIRGRRLTSLSPVAYRPTNDSNHPVQLIGDWRIPDLCELTHQCNVHELEVSTLTVLSKFAGV